MPMVPSPTGTISDEDRDFIIEENEKRKATNAFEEAIGSEMIRNYVKQLESSRKDRTKMFSEIINTLSDASKAKVKDVPNFERDVEKKKDALLLWKAILSTHSSMNSGTLILDTLYAANNLFGIKMLDGQTEDTLAYKERLLRLLVLNKSAKGPVISDELAAAIYFNGLDDRFRHFQQNVQNMGLFTKSIKFPVTVEEMFNLSNSYKMIALAQQSKQATAAPIAVEDSSGASVSSLYAVTNNNNGGGNGKKSWKKKNNEGENNTKGEEGDGPHNENGELLIHPKSGKVVNCFACQGNHYAKDCPCLKAAVKLEMCSGTKS